MNSVQEQRDCKHDSAGNDQDIGHNHRDMNPKNMREHGNIEKKSRCFPVPVRAEHRFCFMDDQQSGDTHKQFFKDHDHNQDKHERITGDEADKHRYLRQFIRNRVENFPYIADHMKASGDKTVRNIRNAGDQKHQPGVEIFSLKVQPDKQGNQ